ncbi:hypothetical protein BDBG_07467 [Blastomyces gilchristii SLH14081]|uniref:Uncharacterized protein n=1 Tax=Blastomyces gilchristii (strain SLH14081) TaxID=559298 RepID=A0A179UVC9_BLAGS|nr:uncharacterized protein BDBG_07467 [Blastomyces gilchristii SLH14081]OAT12075.1 hypothetical protein BDBG_07467 [Blastomyces gilchristii SLH14081]
MDFPSTASSNNVIPYCKKHWCTLCNEFIAEFPRFVEPGNPTIGLWRWVCSKSPSHAILMEDFAVDRCNERKISHNQSRNAGAEDYLLCFQITAAPSTRLDSPMAHTQLAG